MKAVLGQTHFADTAKAPQNSHFANTALKLASTAAALLAAFALITPSTLEAAPQRTLKTKTTNKNYKSTNRTTQKRTLKRKTGAAALAKKKQSENETRGKEEQLGLVPSELNELNQAVYHANASAISGARDTESALRYIPFVTIVNTAGFGQQFDIRGQGRLSANGVNFTINGIKFNPLDSYYGFMPINTVLPSLIQEIAFYPGAGARGGTINVVTSKRFEKPYFQVGGGYTNTSTSVGEATYNVYAQAAEKFGNLNLNVGAGYFQKGGPREDDSSNGFQAVLGAAYEFGLGQSIILDADFYSATDNTTPYNSLWDSAKIDAALAGQLVTTKNSAQLAQQLFAIPSFEPTKDDRKTAGQGEIENTQSRFAGSLGYEGEFNQQLKINITGFYAFDKREYKKHLSTTQLYGYNVDATRSYYFIGTSDNPNSIDQSGSSFDEQKYGVRANIDWNHYNGKLVFGIESIYETAKRNPIQKLTTNNINMVGNDGNTSTGTVNFIFNINTPLDITQWTNAVYFLEKYNITDSFSLQGGGRYQMTKSKIEASGDISAEAWIKVGTLISRMGNPTTATINDSLETNHDNFAFELTPAFRYSKTGVIYARYEMGFSPVPSYAMLERTGGFTYNVENANTQTSPITDADFKMIATNLEDETYNSYEIGIKDYIANFGVIDALLFSANAFYIDSKNEFYFEGDPYSGLSYNTYDKSRRYGGEIALEQYFFGGALGLNESFTYIKAEYQSESAGEKTWVQIPYTYDYKATVGANVAIPAGSYLDLRLWMQNSFYGKQVVISSVADEKLDPYMISDIGLSFGFNKGAIVLTAGVKNVFDTLYYDYYNNNKAASIGEYRYLLGQGRTVFVEGSYKY